jgi:D-alanyl-D-alanine carboxypeptidase
MPIQPLPKIKSSKKKTKLPWKAATLFFVIIVLVFAVIPRLHERKSPSTAASTSFNKQQYSINDPASIWAVVNKGRSLPASYVPTDLVAPKVALRLPETDPEMHVRTVAALALQQMFKDAGAQNIHLMLSSGYRSFSLQKTVYTSFTRTQGQQSTDSSSARPGHSEHQTGLAVDIEPTSRECEVEICFENTNEGKWLAENSYKYGFIIRYQKGQEKITGYEYEPWHVRYVGNELASQIHQSNKTLEQFFNLPTFSGYPASVYQLGSS